ncbi:hypothetical protein PYCC9005_003772 [Savitreella phatthalungensis]
MDTYEKTFPLDPGLFPYTKQKIEELRNARRRLDNAFFFDLVLTEIAQVASPARLYPPRSSQEVRLLHEAIYNSPVDLLKKQCCIYYIMLDWDANGEYARRCRIPDNYRALMDAYWHLDRGKDPDAAFASLCAPGLTPNFASKIMHAFSAANRPDLVVLLVQTLDIRLDNDDKLETYLRAMARVSTSSAVLFTRNLPIEVRRGMFEMVIRIASVNLASFPFDDLEFGWLAEVLPEGILIKQLVARGQFQAAVRHAGSESHSLRTGLRAACFDVERWQAD